MNRRHDRRLARVAVAGCALLGACLWRSYEDIMTVHLDVLSAIMAKAVDNVEDGRRPSSNDMTEMLYPWQRARQFLAQYESQRGRESYRRFAAALDAYQALATSIDTARTDDARWTALRQRLADDAQQWRALVERTREALRQEG